MLKTSLICGTVLIIGGGYLHHEGIITFGLALGCFSLIGAIIKYLD